jgi:hypothetical protein
MSLTKEKECNRCHRRKFCNEIEGGSTIEDNIQTSSENIITHEKMEVSEESISDRLHHFVLTHVKNIQEKLYKPEKF